MAGLLLRLVAATFSTGYLMHDDHFMVVEAGASWAAGEDYNDWLPWNQRRRAEGAPANFAYPAPSFLSLRSSPTWTSPIRSTRCGSSASCTACTPV